MYVVRFFDNKDLLLTQLLRVVPYVGDTISIKGRKGKVSSVKVEDDNNVHIQLVIEKVTKKQLLVVDNSKKKKR